MEWLVALVLGGIGVALIIAGVNNSAEQLFGSLFDASGADLTLAGPGKFQTTNGTGPTPSQRGGQGRKPAP